MPEDLKKNADKKKHDPKEQRKPRHSRNQAGKSDRKAEKIEETKVVPKVHQKPLYEDPGPEFYKNLKRETEEIVKITEMENAKYKKKDIQSNWAKYEMPIESYEDLDEQDVGADYEKLIQAPLAAGGHFQFKHEKSWDTSMAPSLYDKYFEINMDNLLAAISTVPFYERNNINQSEFSETDLLSMHSRASKYKLKYFNNKIYSTPETEAQDRILKSFRENLSFNDKKNNELDNENPFEEITEVDARSDRYEVNLDFNISKTESVTSVHSNKIKQGTKNTIEHDELIFKDVPDPKVRIPEAIIEKDAVLPKHSEITKPSISEVLVSSQKISKSSNEITATEQPVESEVNPVIQSPEELEKWLDDFLDS